MYSNTFFAQKAAVQDRCLEDISVRIEKLSRLKDLLEKNETSILNALYHDLRKPAAEAYSAELAILYQELDLFIRKLKKWARPRRVGTPLLLKPSQASIHPTPLGLGLVLGPWNYPCLLSLQPAIGAVGAGNCVTIKPSELAPETSAILAKIINVEYNCPSIKVVEGDKTVAQALTQQAYDFLFFTGGHKAAQAISQACADKLIPMVMELGGKSPCVLHSEKHLETSLKRILWGKFINAGQTCVAPDYLIIPESAVDAVIDISAKLLHSFYGDKPQASSDYGRIVNTTHFERLQRLLTGATIAHGGEHDADELYVEPTIVLKPTADSALMQEEIFGPILPIVTYSNEADMHRWIQHSQDPLCIYLFSDDMTWLKDTASKLSAGNVICNEAVLQLANLQLPLGGHGQSGFGRYRGQASFNTFSYEKSVLIRKPFDLLPDQRFPPYKHTVEMLKKVFKIGFR